MSDILDLKPYQRDIFNGAVTADRIRPNVTTPKEGRTHAQHDGESPSDAAGPTPAAQPNHGTLFVTEYAFYPTHFEPAFPDATTTDKQT